MLTIKYSDYRGSEMIQPDIISTSWHEGCLTGRMEGEHSVTFGPNYNKEDADAGPNPVAYVMNEAGATVARYEFYPMPWPDNIAKAA
jgi:hypothetical protein